MPPEVAVVEVTRTRTVVVEVPGPSYSDARVLAYLRTVLNTNGDLLTVASNTLARIAVGAAPAGSVPVWNGSSWSVGILTVAVAWDDVTGKPSTFPPSTHSHTPADVTGFNAAAVDAVEEVGNGVFVTTGGVAAAVAGATTNHALLWNGTTWAAGAVPYSALSGVPSTFAPSSHTHAASEITDFNTAWTARLTALGSGASVGDTLEWDGSAWAAAAPSGGGMSNPMTTEWDLIRGGASGTPTRLAVGSPLLRLAVKPDGTLGYCVGGGLVTPGARDSVWYTTGTAVPTTIGSIPWSRVSTSTTSGSACRVNGSTYQINTSAASTNSHATIGATLVTGSYWLPSYATVYQQSYTSAITGTVGLYLATAATVSSNEFFNAPPTANAASASKQGFGLMYSSSDGLTGTWKFIAATTTEYGVVDTGVQWTTDGATPRDFALMIWQGPTAVYGEIWEVSGTPTRLWGGSLPIVSFATTGLQIVAWSLAKTLAASTISVVHGYGTAGYMTGVEAA